MTDDRLAIEALIRAACDAKDYDLATKLAIEHFGSELLGFLLHQLRNPDDASEAFGQWSETFWQTLPRFEWRCSARTWAYKLARNVASQVRKRERRHARHEQLSQHAELSAAMVRVRTATLAYQRTEVKDRFQQLREQLPEEDQSVLILRIDRGLSWLELAEVMLGGDDAPTEQAIRTESVRLRKRFQLAKERLRTLAREAGLLDEG